MFKNEYEHEQKSAKRVVLFGELVLSEHRRMHVNALDGR